MKREVLGVPRRENHFYRHFTDPFARTVRNGFDRHENPGNSNQHVGKNQVAMQCIP